MEMKLCLSLFVLIWGFMTCACISFIKWEHTQKYDFPCTEEEIISKTSNITELYDCAKMCVCKDGCVSFHHQSNQCVLCGYYYFENRGQRYDEGFHWKKTVVNVALEKPTKVNVVSMEQNAANRGVDGGLNQHLHNGSCFFTMDWWYVDLLKVYTLRGILMFDTIDCCPEDPNTTSVLVGNTLEDMTTVAKSNGKINDTWFVSLPAGTTGQYVKLLVNASERISLCEVEVFAPAEGLDDE